jgi:hypothetical protein
MTNKILFTEKKNITLHSKHKMLQMLGTSEVIRNLQYEVLLSTTIYLQKKEKKKKKKDYPQI